MVIGLNDKHLTLVCYRSGYGGDFLCAMIDQALGNIKFEIRDANNRYWSTNYVFKIVNRYVKSLHHILSYYYNKGSVEFIDSLANKIEWADDIKQIYDMCFDKDEDVFVSNLMYMIKSNMNLPHRYNVANLHYYGEFPALDVRSFHDPISVIFLTTENVLYQQYFHALSQIKTSFSVLKSGQMKRRDRLDWKPPPYAVEIDVGKLFFEDTLDDTISETLSNIVGTPLKIDTDELKDYRIKNDAVLKRYFGDDYSSMSVEEFKAEKFKLFEKASKGEIN